MRQHGKTYLFSGHAQLPKGIPKREYLQRTTALLEVDIEKQVIVRAEFITVLPLTNDFLADLAEGYDLHQGIGPLVREMEERSHISSIRAFIKAVEIAYQRYEEFRKAKK